MIKFNIKTVSAKDYQGIETIRCNFTNTNYSDLSRCFRRDPNLPLIDLWKNHKFEAPSIEDLKERELKLGINPVFYKPVRTKAKFK